MSVSAHAASGSSTMAIGMMVHEYNPVQLLVVHIIPLAALAAGGWTTSTLLLVEYRELAPTQYS